MPECNLRNWYATASALAVTAMLALPVNAEVKIEDIVNDAATPGDVLTYGLGPQGQRYSPLKQVNRRHRRQARAGLGLLVRRREAARPGIAAARPRRQDVRHRLVLAASSRSTPPPARSCGNTSTACPKASCPAATSSTAAPRCTATWCIFGTLDAQLVALDQDTGDVVWKEKIDDYQGRLLASPPRRIIADGLMLTGVSGGEFGVVGRVEARDAEDRRAGLVAPDRRRPHGLRYDDGKDENGISGTANESLAGRPVEDRRRGHLARRHLRSAKTGLAYFGTGNPAPWNSHLRPGDNLFSCSTRRDRRKTGQIKWHYQTTPNDGWDFDGVNEFISFDLDGRQASAAPRPTATASSTSSTAPTASSLNAVPVRHARSPGRRAST